MGVGWSMRQWRVDLGLVFGFDPFLYRNRHDEHEIFEYKKFISEMKVAYFLALLPFGLLYILEISFGIYRTTLHNHS